MFELILELGFDGYYEILSLEDRVKSEDIFLDYSFALGFRIGENTSDPLLLFV